MNTHVIKFDTCKNCGNHIETVMLRVTDGPGGESRWVESSGGWSHLYGEKRCKLFASPS